MRFTTATIIAYLAYMATGTLSDPSTTNTIPDATWTVQAFVNGPHLNLTGTVQEIHDKLLAINPNYDSDFADLLAQDAEESALYVNTTNADKGNGATKLRDGVHCVNYSGVWAWDVRAQIHYLRSVHGKPHLPSHTCERVACSWGCGIHWCNDASHSRSLPSYNNIADGAQVVLDECFKRENDFYKGALDHWDQWRAIVRDDNC